MSPEFTLNSSNYVVAITIIKSFILYNLRQTIYVYINTYI